MVRHRKALCHSCLQKVSSIYSLWRKRGSHHDIVYHLYAASALCEIAVANDLDIMS